MNQDRDTKQESGTGQAPTGPGATMEASFPARFRQRLEGFRLGFAALFHALDELGLAQDLPLCLRDILDADATMAEALWILDQPEGTFAAGRVVRLVEHAADRAAEAGEELLETFQPSEREALRRAILAELASLTIRDAYYLVPGRGNGSEYDGPA